MAKEDMLIDEGVAFGRRRSSIPSTPTTSEEVQAALDAAAADLGVDATGAQFSSTELFSPVSGAEPVAGASAGDSQMFMSEGFNPGPVPAEYQKLYGNDPSVIGWKVVTNSDGSKGISVARPQGDADGGLQFQTYGATFETDASGNIVPSTKSTSNTGNTTSATATGTGLKTDAQIAAETAAATAKGERQSAYDLLYSEFSKYGLGSLVTPLKGLITSGASPAEFTIKLRESPEYQARFAGNAQRIAKGLTAIDEATYLAKEDAYQNLMRNYGLPESYWKTGDLGTQEGFTKLIANDVSAVELENRLQTAQQRVLQSNPEVAYTLKAFYPDITNGDILAYALDPKNALDTINRKVTAAEIGGAALAQGLSTSLGGAEGLAAYGITKAQAQQGYQNVAGMVPRGSQLADIYGQQPYNQGTAEAEVFGTAGAADAKKRREKLISLESASFGGSSGVGALGRDKNIYGAAFGQTGQY